MNINTNYQNLQESYLFVRVAQKVREYKEKNPDSKIIRLGIGDVTQPLASSVVEAMRSAAVEMGRIETFRGYEDNNGYDFLKQAIQRYYAEKGVTLEESEIFVSDGAKSDAGNILDIFSSGNTVLIPDPVYPVYVDTNIMAGREIVYISGKAENGFLPVPDKNMRADIIYICSPNNPTGAVYTKEQLAVWVNYASANDAVILFDSAYEAFVDDADLPSCIYQIDGASGCAIELCSLSKTAGFTGVRCGYTIVPHALKRSGMELNKLWKRRQSTKFNGVGYIVQRGAEAVFSELGMKQCRENIAYYKKNARIIGDTLDRLGVWYTGGKSSPYIWLKTPNNMDSWGFFDYLLEKANVVGTPGAGFGENGEGYFRLSAFGSRENVIEAMERLIKLKIEN